MDNKKLFGEDDDFQLGGDNGIYNLDNNKNSNDNDEFDLGGFSNDGPPVDFHRVNQNRPPSAGP